MSRRYRIAYQIVIQSPEFKRQFESYRYEWNDNIKVDNKKDGKVWTIFICLARGIGCGVIWMWLWNFNF
jgi:hypothetical protein